MMHSKRAIDNSFLCAGDSLTNGDGAPSVSQGYPMVLATLFSPQRSSINFGVSGDTSTGIATRVSNYGMSQINQILIIWAGRNDTGQATSVTLANVAAMVARVRSVPVFGQRFLVLTVPPKTDGTEDPLSAARISVDARSDALIAAYPNNYYDIRTIPGILLSPSRVVDGLHFTAASYALVARGVADIVTAKGW